MPNLRLIRYSVDLSSPRDEAWSWSAPQTPSSPLSPLVLPPPGYPPIDEFPRGLLGPPQDSPSLVSRTSSGSGKWRSVDVSEGQKLGLSIIFLIAGVIEVVINRYLLWRKKFHFPLVTAAWTQLFSVIALGLFLATGLWCFDAGRGRHLKRRVLLLGVLAMLNHVLDLYGLMLMPAAIVKVIRTTKPLFASLLMYLVHRTTQSCFKVLSMLVVAAGAALLVLKSDTGLNVPGASCVLVATAVSATHFVLAAIVMVENATSPMSLMLMISLLSLAIVLPAAVYKEGKDAVSEFDKRDEEVMVCLGLSGVLSFAHTALAWKLIHVSDPVYCTLLMCIKLPFILAITVPLFGVHLGSTGWGAIVLALSGFFAYQYLDYTEIVDQGFGPNERTRGSTQSTVSGSVG